MGYRTNLLVPDSLKKMTHGELAYCALGKDKGSLSNPYLAPLFSLGGSGFDPNPTWVRTYPLVPASLKKDDP